MCVAHPHLHSAAPASGPLNLTLLACTCACCCVLVLHSSTLAHFEQCKKKKHKPNHQCQCISNRARVLEPPPEALNRLVMLGDAAVRAEDKSEDVNWMLRNVCQSSRRRSLHCDYHHLIFMNAYLSCWDGAIKVTAVIRVHHTQPPPWQTHGWCNSQVALQACQYVPPCVLSAGVTGQLNKRKVILLPRQGEWRLGCLCAAGGGGLLFVD